MQESGPHACYAALLQHHGGHLETGTVLEIGGDAHGLSCLLKNGVTGLEVGIVVEALRAPTAVQGGAGTLPLADGAFDYVVGTDLLAHFSQAERPRVISELIRVARNKCFILATNDMLATKVDAEMEREHKRLSGASLECHPEQPRKALPTTGEIVQDILAAGFIPSLRTGEGAIEHFAERARGLRIASLEQLKTIARVKGVLADDGNAETDVPYSMLFEVDKRRPIGDTFDPFASLSGGVHAIRSPSEILPASNITIFAAHHVPLELKNAFKLIKAFDVTGKMAGYDLAIRDPEGFFELRNDRCSELSAFHYVWRKRLFGDIVGFCHYRRYLYLFPEDIEQAEARVKAANLKYLLPRIEDGTRIAALLDRHDLLTSRPIGLDNIRQDEQYAMAHYADDYFVMVECVIEKYPFLGPALKASMDATSLYATNMLVCRKALFDVFCRVWFDILECCAGRLDPVGRNAYQARDIAFLSERVFDILVRHMQRLGYRVCELPRIFVET